MVTRIYASDINDMMKEEESKLDGQIENVLQYILDLESSGLYDEANICALKSTYYRNIDDANLAYDWIKLAITLAPRNESYLFAHVQRSMALSYFKEALLSANQVIDLERDSDLKPRTKLMIFYKSICYYHLKDYANCYECLLCCPDDYGLWIIDGFYSKEQMMNVLKGFGFK